MLRLVLTSGALASVAGLASSAVGLVPADVTILVPVVVAAYFSGATIGPCTWLLEE